MTVFTILCSLITAIIFTSNSLEVNSWMIPAAAVWAQASPQTLSDPFFTFIPMIFTALPINRRRLYELRTKMIAFEFRLYASALSSFLFLTLCLSASAAPALYTATHTHLYTVHICLLEFEDELLWFGSQPARSSVALCRGQGVFAYPQGSGNINNLLSGHVSTT